MKISKLSELGGVAVEGVDLSVRVSAEQALELKRLYDEHGLVVFRGQTLTKQQLVDAGAPFGGTMLDKVGIVSDAEVKGITVISTRGPTGEVMPPDPTKLIGDLEWHSDQGYLTVPNRGKILYATQVPEQGGKTGFIDGQLTYSALSDAMKKRIGSLHVVQSWKRAESYTARNRDYRIKGHEELRIDRFPDVEYPIVYEHPISGQKILNVPPLWAAGIVEMPGSDGNALIEQLVDHIKEPQFQYWHSYQVGDALLWDNWRFLHAASGTPGRYVRTLWSITILGGPELGRIAAQPTGQCRLGCAH
jgi:taurine dioxygenase